jgi:diadenosine tetraphosphatase ApaH/serine/threonine PP2A family protein phosphatase
MTGQLTYADWCYLRDLPRHLEVEVPGYGRVVGVHGVPGDDETGIWAGTPDAIIRDYLADVDARMLLAGHTHVPLDRRIGPGRVRVVNPGSAGFNSADCWFARYAVLEFHRDGCRVQRRQAAYDGERVIEKLEASRYPGAAGLLQKLQFGLSEIQKRETFQE